MGTGFTYSSTVFQNATVVGMWPTGICKVGKRLGLGKWESLQDSCVSLLLLLPLGPLSPKLCLTAGFVIESRRKDQGRDYMVWIKGVEERRRNSRVHSVLLCGGLGKVQG